MLLFEVFKSSGVTRVEHMRLLFKYNMNSDPSFDNDQFNSGFIFAVKQPTQICCG